MRIAINGSFWERATTGTGQYLHALLRAMAGREPDNEYMVVVPGRGQLQPLPALAPRAFLYPEATHFDCCSENLAKLWFEQVSFARACQREQAAVAHVPYFASPLAPPIRTIVTIHDVIPLILPRYRGSPLVQLYSLLVSTSARRAYAILADSECSKRDIVTRLGIPASRVHVVYLAAEPRFQPVEDTEPVRRKYRLPEKFLLYFGGYDQRKNVQVLIEAFALLPELVQAGYRLVLAGVLPAQDTPFSPHPEKIARAAQLPDDAMVCIGWVAEEDKPALYASATAFAFPSLYEGFGLPPLEAMSCGTPVITSNVSSLPEVVGDAGLQVDPESAGAWAESIRVVLADQARRSQMRALGLKQAARFSWERTAAETLAVYRS